MSVEHTQNRKKPPKYSRPICGRNIHQARYLFTSPRSFFRCAHFFGHFSRSSYLPFVLRLALSVGFARVCRVSSFPASCWLVVCCCSYWSCMPDNGRFLLYMRLRPSFPQGIDCACLLGPTCTTFSVKTAVGCTHTPQTPKTVAFCSLL